MDDRTFLRVITFAPSRPGLIDSVLRDELVPELASRRDIIDVYVARHGPSDTGERVVASIWSPPDAASPNPDEIGLLSARLADPDCIQDVRLSVEPIAVALNFDRPEEARILRVFEGEVTDVGLPDYVEDVRRGALADAAENPGLIALYLAAGTESRFRTVSAWTCWEAIEAATGGDVAHPIRTRLSDRVTIVKAIHYEVLPGTTRPTPARPPVDATLV
jgi:hypothetical protein